MTAYEPGDLLWWYLGTRPFEEVEHERRACTVMRYVRDDVICVKLVTGPQVCILADRVSSRSRRKRPLSPKRPKGKITMAKPTVRELRRSAKSLGVNGWEEMDEKALAAAVNDAESKAAKKASVRTGKTATTAAAKKAAAKAAPAKKATAKAAAKDAPELPENGNPFKEGTNMFLITEQLIKGGKRSKMVASLKKQITLEPRTKDKKSFDVDSEMDRRVLITGQILKNQHGFEVTREGRGPDATIVAVAP